MNVNTLSNLLRAGGLKLDFVFVSACYSRKTGEAFIEAGVSGYFFICGDRLAAWGINVPVGRSLWPELYCRLCAGNRHASLVQLLG